MKASEIQAGRNTTTPVSLAVAVGGRSDAADLVEHAADLAARLELPWEAVHVETPGSDRESESGLRAAYALKLAAGLGGTVSTVAAATVADGLAGHFAGSSIIHLVMGARLGRQWFDAVAGSSGRSDLVLHIYPVDRPTSVRTRSVGLKTVWQLDGYLLAMLAVVGTLIVAAVFGLFVPARSLDLLFLFPVIAIAARHGWRPAMLAGLLSVFAYNYFILAPAFELDLKAPQNVVMSVVLLGVAAYTSIITGRLRARLFLSDRSARENAELAAFAQRLTRDADWDSTANTVCEQVASQLEIRAAIFREVGGSLVLVRALPDQPVLDPLDQAALEWCWANGEKAGSGTAALATANWQFQPLVTSLGVLAVLGLAREDGRDPVRPEQELLLSTIIAQAALAHERLRLEDGFAATD